MARSVLFGLLFVFGLLLAPSAEAQYIDCGGPQGPCTDTLYGLGNDSNDGPFNNSHNLNRQSRGDGACGIEFQVRYQGRVRIRELDSCAVSAENRCRIEIPQIPLDSGYFNINRNDFDLGPAGILAALGGVFSSLEGNVGFRQLHGTCSLDAGEECGQNSDCPSNAGCVSSCFSDPGTQCASHQDCVDAGLPANDCITEIELDGIGTCTDDATLCLTDADCTAPDICEAGFETFSADQSCACCQSTLGTICQSLLGLPEYPIIPCGAGLSGLFTETNRIRTPDWVFDGGRGTKWQMEEILVPGQQEGICEGNKNRSCGPKGDLWSGALNGKCENLTCTLDSNEICTSDADCPSNAGCAPSCQSDPFDLANPALGSTCDDVAFGGIEGDFCGLAENGFREGVQDILPDGSQNTQRCPNSWTHLVGTPNALCHLPLDIPEGDTQPGCRLFNIGVAPLPDLDCNGIDDTTEGRCTPADFGICDEVAKCPPCSVDAECASGSCINNGDLCPLLNEVNVFLDSNSDGIGNDCTCGDQNGDGAISSVDIGGTALCANAAAPLEDCDATIVDATGDNATTAEDIAGVVSVVNGAITTSDLRCVRNP